ncbi:hypothetical protein [Rhizosaccharibacter radicis]|uniref:Uncharacterized protein n=1 Tax=Rhizosaccharibacter radicis TaxID=2782605 RepID=A0ABT1W030_9PROT|nr:hypothetical protein [Acetobacteraceae bacterium KSS12]
MRRSPSAATRRAAAEQLSDGQTPAPRRSTRRSKREAAETPVSTADETTSAPEPTTADTAEHTEE